ncbi:MAG TPA: signal peptidase I [Fimbriimonas sp.]
MNLTLFFAQVDQGGGLREWIDRLARTPLSQVVTFVAVLTILRVIVAIPLSKTPAHKRHGAVFPFLRFVNEVIDAFVYAGVFVFLLIRPFLLQAFLIPSGSMWPTLLVNDFIVANKAIYRYSDPKHGDIVVFRPPETAATSEAQLDEKGNMKVDFIKRCIGLPGDLVELRRGQLYRNGQRVEEPYVHYSESPDQGITFREKSEDEMESFTKASFKLIKWGNQIIPLNYTEFDANSAYPRGTGSLADTPYGVAHVFQIPMEDQEEAKAQPAQKIPEGFYLMMGDNRNGSFDSRGWGLVPRESIIGRSEFIWLPVSRWGRTK